MHAILASAVIAASSVPTGTTAEGLAPVQHVRHVGDPADIVVSEPSLAELPDGTLFVAGGESPAPHSKQQSDRLAKDDSYWLEMKRPLHDSLWISRDRGADWSRVDLGPGANKIVGDSDVDLAAGADGSLYFATMLFDSIAYEGRAIAVGASHDAGATWTWTQVSKARFDDRPWVAVSPDGTAHLIWNRGDGVYYSDSRDGGRTWSQSRRIHPKGGSSHFAVGPHGELAVRIVPHAASSNRFFPGTELVAVSIDGGVTWHKHAAPGVRKWAPGSTDSWKLKLPRWVEPLAWDSNGRLYYLWTDAHGVWLARSRDDGASWTSWRVFRSAARCYFPYLDARGDGELAATWRCGKRGQARMRVAHIQTGSGKAAPHVVLAGPYSLLRSPTGGAWQGEYVTARFLRDGSIGLVTSAADRTADGWIANGGFGWWRFALRLGDSPAKTAARGHR